MSKHTPGPWRTCSASNGRCQCGLIWSVPADVVVAQLSNDEDSPQRTSDEGAANAALIAAAPDMLAALDESFSILRLLDPLDSPGGSEKLSAAIANAAAALARAKGTP